MKKAFTLHLQVEIEQETDGRWLADVLEFPGVMAYGQSPEDALRKVTSLLYHVIGERLEHGEMEVPGVVELEPIGV